jgi:drug/metabolite transporter (DMT)-like permease
MTWALNVVLGRWLRDYMGPFALAAARFLVASLFFAMILNKLDPEERGLGRDRWLLLGMALSGVVAFSPTLYFGLRFTTATNTTLLTGLGPLITGLLATLLIHKPMSKGQMIGAVISFIGVGILLSRGSFTFWQELRGNIGDFIILVAVTLWGFYSVLGHQVMRYRSPISTTAYSSFLGGTENPNCFQCWGHLSSSIHRHRCNISGLSLLECRPSPPWSEWSDGVL